MSFQFEQAKEVHWNLSVPELIEHAIHHGEGILAENGALVAYTGRYTGRTPKDKFIVVDESTESTIWWDNNRRMSRETFAELKAKASRAIPSKRIYVIDAFAGADPAHRIRVRFLVENAYHALFIKQLLIRPTEKELRDFTPDWTAVNLCREQWVRTEDDGEHDAVIALNFGAKEILIMGTEYAGEMKKSIFSVLNALLPAKGVMPMHCSANIGRDGDTALFFGLSGTGKTTLSADPDRQLIGDDEHGWTDTGVFNFEGGCYAKCIRLSRHGEPQIWEAIRFGAVLENVVLREGRRPNYDSDHFTENTRCAYPLEHISNAAHPSTGGHPDNIFFLTCDASGVLPPISRLTADQAMYHFLNGYTAKVAGTEKGVTEPTKTFSTCFGAPFMPLPPEVYGRLLAEKIARHGSRVWLVNTGWTGGGFGLGHRMRLDFTRAM
ncbi:MAG: phosphoenolpyruvate carboxykinase (ATP), partial [Fimbriimonadaceae bacterium]|nr:phosphoenolpyruvate carboxykinase (ATP) [Fimbriimonadaceae bacterium]